MSAPLFDRLRELVPALGTVSGLAYADTHGTAVLGIEAQRALITALTPCACGAVAGQDCAPDCDLDAGTYCACVCRCTYRLDGYAPGETLCGACLDNCSQDMAVPCEICGARAGFLCPCVTS